MMTTYISLPYPCNLWSTICQKEIGQEELPRDWEEALDYVLENMTHKLSKETLLSYFQERSTLKDIGAKYGITVSAVEQKIERTLQQMQKPSNENFLIYGLDKGQELNALLRTDDTLMATASVENLNLSARAFNCLKRANIHTIGQLKESSDEDLFRVRCLGEGTLREIKQALAEFISPDQKSTVDAGARAMKARLVADISAARTERIKGNLWASDERIAEYLISKGWTLPLVDNDKR